MNNNFYNKMIEKGNFKNLNILSNKFNISNTQSKKYQSNQSNYANQFKKNKVLQPTSDSSNNKSSSGKKQRLFDLQQIKKQLGLIQLKNNQSIAQNNLYQNRKNNTNKDYFSQIVPSFKKQKSQNLKIQNKLLSGENSKKNNQKQNSFIKNIKNEIFYNQKNQIEDNNEGNFTNRITELVKMREEHQKIINSLLYKNKSNSYQSGDLRQSLQSQKYQQKARRNNQLNSKYSKIMQQSKKQFLQQKLPYNYNNNQPKSAGDKLKNHNNSQKRSKYFRQFLNQNQVSKQILFKQKCKRIEERINNQQEIKSLRNQNYTQQGNQVNQMVTSSLKNNFKRPVYDSNSKNQVQYNSYFDHNYNNLSEIPKLIKNDSNLTNNQYQQQMLKFINSTNSNSNKKRINYQESQQQGTNSQIPQGNLQARQCLHQFKNKQKLNFQQNSPERNTQIQPLSIRQSSQMQLPTQQSQFQMQTHVNLIASLSQFQQLTKRKQVNKNNYDNQKTFLENQLHYSILRYLSEQQIGKKFMKKLKNQVESHEQLDIGFEIIYAGMDTQYKNYKNLNQMIKKIATKLNIQNQDFVKIVQFLTQNLIWQGLFRCQTTQYQQKKNQDMNSLEINQYYGLCFQTGNYTQILLSNYPLMERQIPLLIFSCEKKQKNNKKEARQIRQNYSFTIKVDLTLILLSRLLVIAVNKTFPLMLNRLFGYQFKSFDISKLTDFSDFLEFTDRLRQIHQNQLRNQSGIDVNSMNSNVRQRYSLKNLQDEQSHQNYQAIIDHNQICDFSLYGYNKTKQIFQSIPYSLFLQNEALNKSAIPLYQFREMMKSQRNFRKVSENYRYLSIINKKQLPVKSINLKHFQNHFVVLSMTIVEQGLHFISLGKKYDEQLSKTHNQHFNPKNSSDTNQLVNQKYRLCLISSQTKTILQCLILQENQSYPLYLPKQQFQIYISAFQPLQSQKTNTQNILSFTFYIQSQHIVPKHQYLTKLNQLNEGVIEPKQLQFQLRLKQEYKLYTGMIIEQFIEFSFLKKQIQAFFNAFNNENNREKQQKKQESQQLMFSFDQFSESKKLCLNILRVHIKSLDLYIDCINTQGLAMPQNDGPTNKNKLLDQNNQQSLINSQNNLIENISPDIKLTYKLTKVLCDSSYEQNIVELRPNTINLVYLTKNSPIKSILSKRIQSQDDKAKRWKNINFSYKIYTKEW